MSGMLWGESLALQLDPLTDQKSDQKSGQKSDNLRDGLSGQLLATQWDS